MKYFDFHVHAFNDKIAEKAMKNLSETSGYSPYTNGTVEDTRKKLENLGIQNALILPVATKPSQQTVINNWAASINNDSMFYAFGSVHPESDDVEKEIERIKTLGLYGVKLHPDYLGMFVDDPKIIRVFKKCAETGLPVIIHGGFDPLSPDIIHALPEASARAFDAVPDMTLIIAHLGGMYHWDDVEKYLAGKKGNLYFDVAVINRAYELNRLEDSQVERIIKKHGTDRILFASDCPWDCPSNEINIINRLNLSDEEKEMIFHKNAERLLNISTY